MNYYLIPLPLFAGSLILAVIFRNKWIGSRRIGNRKRASQLHLVYALFHLCSQALVIAIGVLALIYMPTRSYFFSLFIVIGLCISIFGDIALNNMSNNVNFIIGLCLFLMAIGFYAAGAVIATGFSVFDIIPGVVLFAVYIGLLVYFLPGLRFPFSIALPVYGFVWCFLIARAFALFYSLDFSLVQASLFTFGGAIFFYGDVRLAIWKFKNPNIGMSLSPVTYLLGQLCIALTLAFFPN